MKRVDYEQLISALNDQRGISFIMVNDNTFTSTIALTDGHLVDITISFPDTFPITLPVILVAGINDFKVHVDPSGKICLFDKDSMLFDVESPEQILIDCFDQAIGILNTPVNSETFLREMTREFNAYWSYHKKFSLDWACEKPQQKYYNTSAVWINNRCLLASSTDEARFLASNYMKCTANGSEKTIPCTIVSLRNGSLPIRIHNEYRWNEVRKYILDNTSSSTRQAFKEFLSKRITGKKYRLFIIICPTEYGDLIFGFETIFEGMWNVTIEHCQHVKIAPVFVRRIDRDHLLIRGGGNAVSLKNKRALLLGCGSVGGFIAANLCQLGIGSIDLLDNDFFSIENVHRHYLGFDSAFSPNTEKADLLKARLEQMYPYTDIDALNYKDRSAESFIQDIERLKCYDIIISALGEPTVNLEINRIIHINNLHMPFVVCFNEPYGIGGHVIAVNLDKTSCLRCLYTKVDSSELCSYRASLVSSGQLFKKNISGCNGSFVPYSSLDSQQTALLASRAIAKILNGEETHNYIESWIGDESELKSNGYAPSQLFENRKGTHSFERTDNLSNTNCPICRMLKEGE